MGVDTPILPATAGELRLDWTVAASVSEWIRFHSLTLAATAEMNRVAEH
jgi:hypothetical protein